MSTLNLTRLYRAHIGAGPDRPERTAFVEANDSINAIYKVASLVALIDGRSQENIQDLIYNCRSAAECIKQGVSEDEQIRIFETVWIGDDAVDFVEHPLFLVSDPAPLVRKWMETQASLAAPLLVLREIVHEYDQTYDAEQHPDGRWTSAASIPVEVMQRAKHLVGGAR
jgi:hypothetical protein